MYTSGYAVDQDGHLIWTQFEFETAQQKLREQMLAAGFNRAQIERMEEKGRREGQERRRFWDKMRAEKNEITEQKNKYKIQKSK